VLASPGASGPAPGEASTKADPVAEGSRARGPVTVDVAARAAGAPDSRDVPAAAAPAGAAAASGRRRTGRPAGEGEG